MSPEVVIIILNWNGWKDTIECLESLYQINYPDYMVMVVDNHSQDQSLEKIKEYSQGKIVPSPSQFLQFKNTESIKKPLKKPLNITELTKKESESYVAPQAEYISSFQRLILIKNDRNYGFAEGNNIGIRFALKNLKPQYILLLNNDTIVDPNFLTELVKTAQTGEKIGFVGPKTYFFNAPNIIQAAGGGYIDFLHGESHELAFKEKDKGKYDECLELDYVGGSCLLVKKKVIEKVGILDAAYFMYWEDVDWCFKGKEAGYKCVYSPKSKIWHKYGSSSQNYLKTYYHNRNRLYFVKKHGKKSVYRSFLAHYLPEVLMECGYQLIYRRNLRMFKSLFKGTVDGLRMN